MSQVASSDTICDVYIYNFVVAVLSAQFAQRANI